MTSGISTDRIAISEEVLRQIEAPTNEEIQVMQRRIGAKIDANYENGSRTPTQVNKIIAITLSIFATIGTIAMAVTCFYVTTVVLPLIASIALAAGAAFGFLYYFTAVDYDNPTERAGYINEIANMQLSKIAKKHTIKDLIGYNLLQTENPRTYVIYQKAAKIYKGIKEEADYQLSRSRVIYDQQMNPFRNRENQAHHRAAQHHLLFNHRRTRPSFLQNAAEMFILSGDINEGYQAHQARANAEGVFGRDHNAQSDDINETFRGCVDQINAVFAQERA